MATTFVTEALTPLDLLMPKTYIRVLMTFRTARTIDSISESLQAGLETTVKSVPWISGRVSQSNSRQGNPSNLEIRWAVPEITPKILDMGSIEASYKELSAQNMPSRAIPERVWPVSDLTDQVSETAGARVFAAGLFSFGDHEGIGLCVCMHHSSVDAKGFTEVLGLWARNTTSPELEGPAIAGTRLNRLSDMLHSGLNVSAQESLESLLALHPEFSTQPPTIPTSFPACTSTLFSIPIERINAHREALRSSSKFPQTINTVLCALLWSSITRARMHGNEGNHSFHTSRLAIAVNGRPRVEGKHSSSGGPYLGNMVVYALAKLATEGLVYSNTGAARRLSGVCDAIAESTSPAKITSGHVAEICRLVNKSENPGKIFVGWDLFSSRDLTITSWATFDLYDLCFGGGLGKADFIRLPYTEADGVCIILPRKRPDFSREYGEKVEVVVMLRNDHMERLQEDYLWQTLIR
ncbi:hypothetical protein GQ53DRAFT_818529 [Thozetella sp. PMI_491]|nr:hypothetical protein GQ53DRAFT_818529 [Thozetella sp. PMI_491]